MRRLSIVGLLALFPLAAQAQSAGSRPNSSAPAAPPASPANSAPNIAPAPRTPKQRFHHYLFDTFGPLALARAGIASGIDQSHNAPPEWGQGAAGYGSRLSSDFGQGVIESSTSYALSEVLRQDVTYHRCECSGFFPRLGHALLSTQISEMNSFLRTFGRYPSSVFMQV